MTAKGPEDRWEIGDAYDRYIGRWSRRVAREFLAWLDPPPGLAWLDVGCGTGALTGCIAETRAPRRLVGIDASPGFLAHARQEPREGSIVAEFRQADAHALPFADHTFDRVVSGLVLNFLPGPSRAVAEMARVARPDGEVALYVWDYAEGMQPIRRFWDEAAALDSQGAELDEGKRFPICRPEPLRHLFAASGLRAIAVRAIEVPTTFRDFDDYWEPFLGGQGPAPSYCTSLTEEVRAVLRERLRRSLPTQPDGSVRLIARAWAVRARKT